MRWILLLYPERLSNLPWGSTVSNGASEISNPGIGSQSPALSSGIRVAELKPLLSCPLGILSQSAAQFQGPGWRKRMFKDLSLTFFGQGTFVLVLTGGEKKKKDTPCLKDTYFKEHRLQGRVFICLPWMHASFPTERGIQDRWFGDTRAGMNGGGAGPFGSSLSQDSKK